MAQRILIIGAGFAGIEAAAEMPARLRAILGDATDCRVIVVEQAGMIGSELGPSPRPVIQQALRELGVACRVNAAVAAIDAGGLWTSAGCMLAATRALPVSRPSSPPATRHSQPPTTRGTTR